MDDAVRIIIFSLTVIITFLVLYTSRKAKKFEASHQTGLYKTRSIIRGLEALLLLVFAAAALMTFRSIITPVTGIIFMAVSFICWLPFQILIYTMLYIDDNVIVYINPLRKPTEISWQSVNSVSVSRSGILIKSDDNSIKVHSYFFGFDKIKETIKENCPAADK